ncbi:ATP synthase [Nocardioides sp. Root614]|nr:ATP synthase [Nocardioides sp. Root614]KRA87619.1 ATP synthase [Nocardioides sp. Root682]
MCRFLSRGVVAWLMVAGTVVLAGGSVAASEPKCDLVDPITGECAIEVVVPSDDPDPSDDEPKSTGGGQACYWDPAKQGVVKPPAGPVPCSTKDGYWSNAYNCYIRALAPQPLAGDPGWKGHEPGDGAVYFCFQPQTGLLITIWAQDPPPGSRAGPSPREVAQVAVAKMKLKAVDIGIVPKPGPDSIGLVGMPVWMWVQAPNDHTFGPITASASAGGITITATAKVERIGWDMGDGTEVVCRSAGSPYKPSYGRRDSPDCGHTYSKTSAREPDEAYTVTATSTWVVTWSGAGQTGTIRLDGLSRSTQIRVGEAQVLVN